MMGAWKAAAIVVLDLIAAVVSGVVVGQLVLTGLTAAGWPSPMRWFAACTLGGDMVVAVLRMSSTWFKKVTGP